MSLPSTTGIPSAPPAYSGKVGLDLDGSEVSVNEHGGKQTKLLHRLDLLSPTAMISLARVLAPGAEKYGEYNWHKITVKENLNHALGHIMAYINGDKSEAHLGHAFCRLMFALDREIDKTGKLDV